MKLPLFLLFALAALLHGQSSGQPPAGEQAERGEEAPLEVFEPTEEVPLDSSVSFPVNI